MKDEILFNEMRNGETMIWVVDAFMASVTAVVIAAFHIHDMIKIKFWFIQCSLQQQLPTQSMENSQFMAFAAIAMTVLSRMNWFTCPRPPIVAQNDDSERYENRTWNWMNMRIMKRLTVSLEVGEALRMWRHAGFEIV